jgi:hypothetical protein
MFSRSFIRQKLFTLNFFQKFNFSKIIPIRLSDLGEGNKEATIKKWYKKEGEEIDEVYQIINFNLHTFRKKKLLKYSPINWSLIYLRLRKEKFIKYTTKKSSLA